jgi:replication factor A1
MIDLRKQAEELHNNNSDKIQIGIDEIEAQLKTMVQGYSVPLDEAIRSILNRNTPPSTTSTNTTRGANSKIKIQDINSPGQWVDIQIKLVDLWVPNIESIDQVGLVGDETGTIKFTKWAKSNLPKLEEGKTYLLKNVVTDEWGGRFSIKLNRTTIIETLDQDIEIGDGSTSVEGALVDIQSGSGLIKRCTTETCTRVLQNGVCAEHGEVTGKSDLRLKAVIDDGVNVHEVILNSTITESLTGIGLAEAESMAIEAVDTSVVLTKMRGNLLGKYYLIHGSKFSRYLIASEAQVLSDPVDMEAIMIQARSF